MSERARRFDALYSKNPDPWGFRDSAYERAKYQATIAALPEACYRLGIEAGCSIGELTALLAARCDKVIGLDVSAVALAAAAKRGLANVEFRLAELPAQFPDVDADLIVLSEVLYFLSAEEIDALAARIAPRWRPGGTCVLVNWLGPTDEALSGSDAADRFIAALYRLACPTRQTSETAKYRLDVLRNAR